jgi:hypothetical protein
MARNSPCGRFEEVLLERAEEQFAVGADSGDWPASRDAAVHDEVLTCYETRRADAAGRAGDYCDFAFKLQDDEKLTKECACDRCV